MPTRTKTTLANENAAKYATETADTALDTHVAHTNPHTVYALDTDLTVTFSK